MAVNKDKSTPANNSRPKRQLMTHFTSGVSCALVFLNQTLFVCANNQHGEITGVGRFFKIPQYQDAAVRRLVGRRRVAYKDCCSAVSRTIQSGSAVDRPQ